MPKLDWSRALLVAMLALGLFFGANHLYQQRIRNEPLLERLGRLEAVASARIISEGGSELLLITPEPAYRGLLQDLYRTVEAEVAAVRKPPRIRIEDRRSAGLDQFAAAASPALHEAARCGCYREAAADITAIASALGLTDCRLTVDSRYLYLQARDGGACCYLMVPLPPLQEGECADA